MTIVQPAPMELANGWAIKILPTLEKFPVRYEESTDGDLARFTVNVFRAPALRLLEIRWLLGSTAEEQAGHLLTLTRRASVERCRFHSGLWHRYKRRDGHWGYTITLGGPVNDPLIQLELEMMIDLESGVYR